MVIVDTNVVSELMRRAPDQAVMDWFGRRSPAEIYLSAISAAELRRGVAILPKGKRQADLMRAIEAMLAIDFAGRILPFDSDAAAEFAAIYVGRKDLGRPISFADCQIAAIARSRNAGLVTRNTGDFEGCGVALTNPWTAEANP